MLSSAYRNGNRSGTGQVRFYTTNGTARSGSDYSGFNRIYSFRSGQSYLDVTVKTNKDTTKENTEYFYGRISAYRSGDRISGSSAQIQYLKDVSTSSSSTYTISRRSSSTIMRAPMLSSASTEQQQIWHRSSPLLHHQRHRQKRQ